MWHETWTEKHQTWNAQWEGSTLLTEGHAHFSVPYVFRASASNYSWWSIIDDLLYCPIQIPIPQPSFQINNLNIIYLYKFLLRKSSIFTFAGLSPNLLLEISSPALENKHSAAADVDGLQRYFFSSCCKWGYWIFLQFQGIIVMRNILL